MPTSPHAWPKTDSKAACWAFPWDGTGYGPDGTVWGGEFLLTNDFQALTRVASLRQFRLPGSARAVKEPRRAALGLLYEITGRQRISAGRICFQCARSLPREISVLVANAETGDPFPLGPPAPGRGCSTPWHPSPACSNGSGLKGRQPWSWSSPHCLPKKRGRVSVHDLKRPGSGFVRLSADDGC